MLERQPNKHSSEAGSLAKLEECLRAAIRVAALFIVEDVVDLMGNGDANLDRELRAALTPIVDTVITHPEELRPEIIAEFSMHRKKLAEESPLIYAAFVQAAFRHLAAFESLNDSFNDLLHSAHVLGWEMDRTRDEMRNAIQAAKNLEERLEEIEAAMKEVIEELQAALKRLSVNLDRNEDVDR